MSLVAVIVDTETGKIFARGRVEKYTQKRDSNFRRFDGAFGSVYEYGWPTLRMELTMTSVQAGSPNNIAKPHNWDPQVSVAWKCQDCGHVETFNGRPTPPCPGTVATGTGPHPGPSKDTEPVPKPLTKSPCFDACQCGAMKTYGTKRGELGHSSWCPWRES